MDKSTLEGIVLVVIWLIIAKRILIGPQRKFAALSGVMIAFGVVAVLLAPDRASWMADAGAISFIAGLIVAVIMMLTEAFYYFSQWRKNKQ